MKDSRRSLPLEAGGRIRKLIEAYLSDNHNIYGVEFIDELLRLASEVGEIKCNLAGDRKLRFQTAGQPAWEVEVGRARAKLRMLCARLGVHESGDQEVSLYGGEGLVHKELPTTVPDSSGGARGAGLSGSRNTSLAPPRISTEWRVRFNNTPSEQEFTVKQQ